MQFIVGESVEDNTDLTLGIILREKRCGGSAQEPIAGDVERFGDADQNNHAEIVFSRFDKSSRAPALLLYVFPDFLLRYFSIISLCHGDLRSMMAVVRNSMSLLLGI